MVEYGGAGHAPAEYPRSRSTALVMVQWYKEILFSRGAGDLPSFVPAAASLCTFSSSEQHAK